MWSTEHHLNLNNKFRFLLVLTMGTILITLSSVNILFFTERGCNLIDSLKNNQVYDCRSKLMPFSDITFNSFVNQAYIFEGLVFLIGIAALYDASKIYKLTRED